jgi:hypothetical protein
MEVTELEDGSVELGSPEVEIEDTGFMANLADQLDDDEIAGISAYVLEKVDEDKNARSEWLETYSQGLNLLGLRYENRSEPLMGLLV